MKEKIIMFGASSAGVTFIKKYQNEYEILAIADNDRKKHNTTLYNYLIIDPLQIKDYKYDYIVITSSFLLQIKDQLLKELKIDPLKIKALPKGGLYSSKSYRPFEHEKTMILAREILLFIIEILASEGIRYFVDHGTLLGLVRDGDIISWDDDIDFSIHSDDLEKVVMCMSRNIKKFPLSNELEWGAHLKYNQENKPCSITLSFDNNSKSDIKQFPISITANYFVDGLAIQTVTYAPEDHFKQCEYIMYKGRKISVPYKYELYLEYHYGEWKQPKKDISFLDICNYQESNVRYQEIIF